MNWGAVSALQLVRLSGAIRSSFPQKASGEVEPFLLPTEVDLTELQIHSLQFLTLAVCFACSQVVGLVT